jgi:hypothetical protein
VLCIGGNAGDLEVMEFTHPHGISWKKVQAKIPSRNEVDCRIRWNHWVYVTLRRTTTCHAVSTSFYAGRAGREGTLICGCAERGFS